jgi:hypothetical protein
MEGEIAEMPVRVGNQRAEGCNHAYGLKRRIVDGVVVTQADGRSNPVVELLVKIRIDPFSDTSGQQIAQCGVEYNRI